MIVDNLNKCDGIASYVMNYYKKINLEKFQIDVLVSKSDNGVYDEYKHTIENLGGKVILRHNIKNSDIVKEIKNIKQFFKENKYDIVHSHIINVGYFYLKYARLSGVKIRILHSHSTYLWSKNIFNYIRNLIFTFLAKYNANYNFACSKLAGEALFGKKQFTIIKNAINLEKYKFNNEIREKYRKDLNIENNVVYGHIGRFNVQKNHIFLLKVFEEINRDNKNSKLLLIGKGELQKEIQEEIKKRKLENSVIILGEREDVNNLLQAIDIFLLPSLFEGLPIVGIEAQAAGLPCYFSNTITDEVKILETSKFIDIDNLDEWKNTILKNKNKRLENTDVQENIVKAGYDINKEVKVLEKTYEEMIMGIN